MPRRGPGWALRDLGRPRQPLDYLPASPTPLQDHLWALLGQLQTTPSPTLGHVRNTSTPL